MGWVSAIGRELVGLFVDDGAFAVAIVVWIGVAGLVLTRLPGGWQGPLVFVGLAGILAWSCLRAMRRRK